MIDAQRDYLRANGEAAAAYASLKRALATRLGDDRDAYTQAKGKFIVAKLAGI